MKQIWLLVVAIMSFHAPVCAISEHEVVSLQIPDMRFYAVKAIKPVPEGRIKLIAAGQIKQKDQKQALIIAFSIINGKYKEISREIFSIGLKNAENKTRIRSLVCMNMASTNQCLVVVNGKAGPEHREMGFIRSYLFDGTFHLIDSITFSDPDTSYTHGYPLIQADINKDGKNEIICGGFSGSNDRDHADIRFFSIDENGHLSTIKGFQTNRIHTLKLRINALAAGDFNGDGIAEIVAAGRTVENDIEHAAFAVFSDQTLIWKQLNDLGSCRYRYATVTDITGDGRPELVLGGRIDQESTKFALLDIWKAHNGEIHLISRYRFTGIGSTRLRVMEPLPEFPGCLIIGGRQEIFQDGRMKWKGFIQQVIFKSGALFSYSKPIMLDKDWETRVRTIDVYENSLITAGFTEDKTKASAAFISIYQLK
ncbi:MAG: VCBS repeat-containing protein [Deltaproteobacteria bacterium]|nr:VCBS repeat-containing protein [Deltaproteobacteria bacterium]